MFGRDCLTVDGRNVAFFHDAHPVVKLAPPAADVLLDSGEGVTAHMGERVMGNWVAMPLPPDGGPDRWSELLARATAYLSSGSAGRRA
jgi:hypothetical protein